MPKTYTGGKTQNVPPKNYINQARQNQSAPQILTQPPTIVSTQQQANQQNNTTFPNTDSRPYHELKGGRNYYLSQNMTIDQQLATMNYLSPTPETGSLYSMSQNLNNALKTGQTLTANQKYVYDELKGAMHNLGENLTLTRYDHPEAINAILRQAGLTQDYENYTISQIKNAIIGTTQSMPSLESTSYNEFRHAPVSNPFTNRAVKLSYLAPADTQAFMPGNGAGGALGEIVLADGQRKTIVDVRWTGNRGRTKGSQTLNKKQIEIVYQLG